MSDKPKRAIVYRVVAISDGTYTVEAADGTGDIAKTRGFLNRTAADAWIAEQKRAREGKPCRGRRLSSRTATGRSARRRGSPRGGSLIDSRDFLAARRRTEHEVLMPAGAKIAFAGGADCSDHARIWDVLDKVYAKHPDMVLLHGGSRKAPSASPPAGPRNAKSRRSSSSQTGRSTRRRHRSSATISFSRPCRSVPSCFWAQASPRTSPTSRVFSAFRSGGSMEAAGKGRSGRVRYLISP